MRREKGFGSKALRGERPNPLHRLRRERLALSDLPNNGLGGACISVSVAERGGAGTEPSSAPALRMPPCECRPANSTGSLFVPCSRMYIPPFVLTCALPLFTLPLAPRSLYLNGRVTRFVTVNNTHACILRQDGSVVVNKMNERRAVGVSRKHGVAVDWGDNVRFCELPKDVETLMRARAVSGYGVKKHASVEDDNILSVWEFVDRGEYENTFVDTMFTDELKQDQIITIYEDENRRTLARTCGWAQQPASPDDCIPGTLESTKAGVRRVFFLDDFEAICEILDDSTESKLVRMCVTGYKPESANWMKAARDLIITVRSNPYLVMLLETMLGVAQSDSTPAKARFPFLFDDSIAIADRVGVAAKFLPAALLSSYIKDLYKSCLVSGDISGLVLTGLGTSHGMDLLQRYVDCSGDVQTAALVTAGLTKPERVHEWLESYRDLLNGWGLWTVRAKLDIERGEILRRR